MKRYDPIEYYNQGGHGLGQMAECADGDYLRADDAKAEIDKLRGVIRDFITIYCGSHPEKDESSVLAAAHSALANEKLSHGGGNEQ